MEQVPLGVHTACDLPIDEVERLLREAFEAEGFGALTEVDMQAVLQRKVGEDIGAYRLIGFCHPRYALEAVQAWRGFGLVAPCNVAIYEADGHRAVQAFDPLEIAEVHRNPDLLRVAEHASAAIRRAVERFEGMAATASEES